MLTSFLGPSASRAGSHRAFLGRSLKTPKFTLQVGEPAFYTSPSFQELHHLVSLWPRLPWALHCPQSLHGYRSNKALLSIGPCWLLYDLKEVITELQKPPGLFMSLQKISEWLTPTLGRGLANMRLLLSRKGLGDFSIVVCRRHFFACIQELKVISPKPIFLIFCSVPATSPYALLLFSVSINPLRSFWLLSQFLV